MFCLALLHSSEKRSRKPFMSLLALSRHRSLHRTCPLLGVERTTIGGELHLRLCRNDLLKISRPERSQKTRWGKHWGKQFEGCDFFPGRITPQCRCRASSRHTGEASDIGNDVRIYPESGHVQRTRRCPLCANSCQMRRSKQHLYSITSSARASSAGGTSRPSAFAVVRLMTRSNLVGACTGRSAGFSPLRMRST